MKTEKIGQVLGITKQRKWWNRQTNRRSTEEMAARSIKQSKIRSLSRTRDEQGRRTCWKLETDESNSRGFANGVVTELSWRVRFHELVQLTESVANGHILVNSLDNQPLARVTIQPATSNQETNANGRRTFLLPAHLAQKWRLALGQHVRVGLRRLMFGTRPILIGEIVTS